MNNKTKIILASVGIVIIGIFLVLISLIKFGIIGDYADNPSNNLDDNESEIIDTPTVNVMSCTKRSENDSISNEELISFTFNSNNYLSLCEYTITYISEDIAILNSVKENFLLLNANYNLVEGASMTNVDSPNSSRITTGLDFRVIDNAYLTENNITFNYSATDTRSSLITRLTAEGYNCN